MSNITIQELQQKLESVEILIGLLVGVVDKTIPKLRLDINKIVGTVEGGFNTVCLTKQVKDSINTALDESDYGSLINTMHSIKLQLAAEIKEWKHETETYKETSKIKLIAISVAVGIILGSVLSMCSSNSSKEYQNILSKLENQPTCKLPVTETSLIKSKKHNK